MWTNDAQRCQAILTLLRRARLERLWTETGPTDRACGYIEHGSPLSHGEAIVLQVAFDLWNGNGGARVSDLLEVLDGDRLLDVASLLVELSNSHPDINRWMQSIEGNG